MAVEALRNPYRPGYGEAPPHLAGRNGLVRRFERVIAQRTAGTGGQGPWLAGPRGVGKTVLLSEARRLAATNGWIDAYCEVTSDSVAEALGLALRRAQHSGSRARGATRALAAMAGAADRVSLTVADPATGLQVQMAPKPSGDEPTQPSVDLVDVVVRLGRELFEHKRGVLIALDEVHQLAGPGLKSLLAIQQAANVEALPVVIVGAGLPGLSRAIAPLTYGDRQEVVQLDRLLDADVEAALRIPATAQAVEVSPDAMAVLVGAAQGYPYRVQMLGYHAWDAAAEGHSPGIEASHAEMGVERTEETLAKNLYLRQWLRISNAPRMRAYLVAMAHEQQGAAPVRTAAVARRLGATASSYTQARHRLVESGLVAIVGPGLVNFADPGLASFLRTQATRPAKRRGPVDKSPAPKATPPGRPPRRPRPG